MGDVIHKVNAGGVKGLEYMGFLTEKKKKYSLGEVQTAFSQYFEWITSITTEEERARWGWSVVTAENHLCKHSRLYELISKL